MSISVAESPTLAVEAKTAALKHQAALYLRLIVFQSSLRFLLADRRFEKVYRYTQNGKFGKNIPSLILQMQHLFT